MKEKCFNCKNEIKDLDKRTSILENDVEKLDNNQEEIIKQLSELNNTVLELVTTSKVRIEDSKKYSYITFSILSLLVCSTSIIITML